MYILILTIIIWYIHIHSFLEESSEVTLEQTVRERKHNGSFMLQYHCNLRDTTATKQMLPIPINR